MEKRIAAQYAVPVLDMWSVSGIQPCLAANCEAFTVDGLHPNDKGAEMIANRLVGFLKML